MNQEINSDFFKKDVLEVAPLLLGKNLIRHFPDGRIEHYLITETEAYKGVEDLACHASKGRTPRTEIMFHEGGSYYVYLIYGMHWMLNIVTGTENNPQAVLIRGIKGFIGPGRVSKKLAIDQSFYGESALHSSRLFIRNGLQNVQYIEAPRIGIDYAGEHWKNVLWRFVMIGSNI